MTYEQALEKHINFTDRYDKKEFNFKDFTETLKSIKVQLCFTTENQGNFMIASDYVLNDEERDRLDFDVVILYEYVSKGIMLADMFEKEYKA